MTETEKAVVRQIIDDFDLDHLPDWSDETLIILQELLDEDTYQEVQIDYSIRAEDEL